MVRKDPGRSRTATISDSPASIRTKRSGQVLGADTNNGLFRHTVGDHLLTRRRWPSIPLRRRALSTIDAVAGWELTALRRDDTLDKRSVSFAFERTSLVGNPMSIGRAREANAGVTPISFELASVLTT